MTGGRKLRAEERILWGKVASSTRALPGRAEDARAYEQDIAAMLEAEEAGYRGSKQRQDLIYREQVPAKTKHSSGSHQPLEKPVQRKIAKGRVPIEARIDLHGLFQDEAHDLLLDFLVRAHGRGMRHVLVITGKGSSMGSEGVLRRAVPLWFSTSEFRFLISSYHWAARHHGGEGALYVRLSRTRAQP